MRLDDRALGELIDESEDLHSDALRDARAALPELNDLGHSRRGSRRDPEQIREEVAEFNSSRRRMLTALGYGGTGLAVRATAAGGIAAALMAAVARPAHAQADLDVQILQTASSLERLAVNTYETALQLDFIANGNPVVREFAQTTMRQHDEHRQAFQAHTKALGGQVQDAPNPRFLEVVEAATPNLKQPGDVASLAQDLEKVATDTYLLNLVSLKDTKAREIMGSVMGVEAQHLGILRAVKVLLYANSQDLIAIPVDATRLLNSAGSIATLDPLEQVDPGLLAEPSSGALR